VLYSPVLRLLIGSIVLAVALLPVRADAQSIPHLSLRIAPIVDVGSVATFSLSAQRWPAGISVMMKFVSAHHGFSGPMYWSRGCGCYQARVRMVWHVHPLEQAYAVATVRFPSGQTVQAATRFRIRGLAAGGQRFAPGGQPFLSAWVSDSTPALDELEHFCAWVHASDNFPISGVTVHVTVHTGGGDVLLTGARTNQNGVGCAEYTFSDLAPHVTVAADVSAAGQTARVSFTPS